VIRVADVEADSLIANGEINAAFRAANMDIELPDAAVSHRVLQRLLKDSEETEGHVGRNRARHVLMSEMNFGAYPMANGRSRLETHYCGEAPSIPRNESIDTGKAREVGLVTSTPDDIDWDDEVRIAIEERASLSPDALTGMEASLRFAGPETMLTRVFGRLTAWQNWIFQRPNAVGEQGALKVYGTGARAKYDWERV
jgi:benzoyl-CoA-dihydrodiol lyase